MLSCLYETEIERTFHTQIYKIIMLYLTIQSLDSPSDIFRKRFKGRHFFNRV